MRRLLMLKGLPASGKSTFAKKLVGGDIRDMGSDWVRVNKDDLREMMHNYQFSKSNEKEVLKVRDFIINQALQTGKNVVVDDTNFSPYHKEVLQQIAVNQQVMFDEKFFDTPLDECLERNIKRVKPVREYVIRQMYNQYLKPADPAVAPPIILPDAPWAIICDIDGTLADMTPRIEKYGQKIAPYKWDAVGMDNLVREVAFVLERFKFQPDSKYGGQHQTGIKILLVSGRDGVCRPETEKWLADNNVRYDELLMRSEGNNEKDNIIKQRIYDTQIVGNYNIEFVLDDRDQVVKMWRANGLKCFQVAEGNF